MEWRDVPDYEGYYKINDKGEVYSVTRQVKHEKSETGLAIRAGKRRKAKKHIHYPVVQLHKKGKRKDYMVAELMLLVFVGPRPDKCFIHYRDGNPENVTLANLEYKIGYDRRK